MTDSADRRNRVRWGGGAGRVLGAAMALIAGIWAEPAAAQTGPAFGADPQWCRLDDPGTWRRLRQEAAEAGASDTSGIVCPERRGAEGALPERLHLPMPCGRTMVFQRIDVPVEHMLDQVVGAFGRRVDLASETVQTSLSSGPWAEAVSGGFTLSDQAPDGVTEAMAKPSARAYYLARYETTEAQALVWSMGLLGRDGAPAQADAPACAAYRDALAALGPRADAAAGGFSWFDGIA
ncbi:MAG: hypothetical protein VX463_09300, partial [Pseudomonadota bacterium]|nr:hypothetical protein [Pseudomonadota bacterium]